MLTFEHDIEKKKKKREQRALQTSYQANCLVHSTKKRTKNCTNYLEEENLINNLLHAHNTIY